MRRRFEYVVSNNLKKDNSMGHLVFLIFLLVEGGEQAFVVVIKHLIDFDRNKLSLLSGWVCFIFQKMIIIDKTTVCVRITSEKFILKQ